MQGRREAIAPSFQSLIHDLGKASSFSTTTALAGREPASPEKELGSDAIARLQQKIQVNQGGAIDIRIKGFARLSKDCGPIDKKGRPRSSFAVWKRWMSLPKINKGPNE